MSGRARLLDVVVSEAPAFPSGFLVCHEALLNTKSNKS